MIRWIVLAVALIATPAYAEQRPVSPLERVLADKLFSEMNAGLWCSAELLTAKQELEQAKARIKELESKEPQK